MYKRTMFLVTVALPVIISFTAYAVPGKCSPCHEAKLAREARKSKKDIPVVVNQPQEDEDDAAKGCKPCQRTTRDEVAPEMEDDPSKCGCKTTRDEMVADLDDPAKECTPCGGRSTRDELEEKIVNPETDMVEACCAVCEEPDSLGCQGENRDRCRTCLRGRKKLSVVAAAAAALAAINVLANELDAIPEDSLRAPREPQVSGPCSPCDRDRDRDRINRCEFAEINEHLDAINHCCHRVNRNVECQGFEARKCCKKIKHELHEIEELVESVIDETEACCSVTEGLLVSIIDETEACCSVSEGLLVSIIDQTAACCSVTEGLIVSVLDQSTNCCSIIETAIGDPATSILDIPLCLDIESVTDIVNTTDADLMTWVKSLYILLYTLFNCNCC